MQAESCVDTVEYSTVNCPNIPSTYCGPNPVMGPVKVFLSLVLLLESNPRPVVHPLIQKFKFTKKGLSEQDLFVWVEMMIPVGQGANSHF